MLYSYRITKYFESNAKGDLISSEDEWTSFSEVGNKVSLEEYLKVERSFLCIIKSVCEYLRVTKLKVADLEYIKGDPHVVNEQLLTVVNACELAQGILREEVWCKLVSPEIELHFGYDFYMYLVSKVELSDFFTKTEFTNVLNIQKFKSPYI
ncbi:hypothetical protein ACLEUK_07160 [Pseudescherichia vulneris]